MSSERVACRACGTAHHPECWVHGRGCGHYACAAHPGVLPPPVAARPALRAVRAVRAAREPLAVSAYAVGIAGAVALVFFGLIAIAGRDLHPQPPPGAALLAPSLMTAGFLSGPSILHVHDVAVDLGARPSISWDGGRKYVPAFRFGRDVADQTLIVTEAGGRHRVDLPELVPGASYAYRISGWTGGGTFEGRFVAPPPGNAAPSVQRVQLLDLPDGGAVAAPTFGPAHLARPLWARASVPAAATLAGGCAVVHDGRHVHGLDATSGQLRWSHPAPCATPATPAVADGTVVVATDAGPLALDLESGRPRWRLPLAGVTGLHAAGDEVYVQQAGRMHRVQAADGRLVAIVPLPAVDHAVQVAGDHALIQIREPGDARGELLLRGVDRLRGERRWEKLLFGDELPVLAPVAAGDRFWVATKARLDARALATGQTLGSWPLPAPALVILPTADGGALIATGGPVPHAHRLDAEGHLVRAWTLPSPPTGGAVCGDRAVLADPDGVQVLEMKDGPRWAITGWGLPGHVALDAEGHLLAQVPGEPHGERVYALGLR